MEEPSESLVRRIEALVSPRRPIELRRIRRGYTPAERWVVQLDDGSSCFLKVGVDQMTAGWLRDEYNLYSRLGRFVPCRASPAGTMTVASRRSWRSRT